MTETRDAGAAGDAATLTAPSAPHALPQPPAPVPSAPSVTAAAPAAPARARPPAAAGAASPGTVMEVVYEDEHVLMEWSVRTPATDTIAVTFDPILVEPSEPAYAASFLHRAGIDTLCVRKKSEHFYQPLTREQFDAAARPVLAHYRRRLAYGSSLGAYAVLYFCMHGFETVISSSPRVSAHPRFGRPHWQERVPFQHSLFDAAQPASSGAVVFYDPHDAMDRRFVDEGLRHGWPQARFVAVPYAGHPSNQFLSEIGYIAPFVQAVVAGKPLPVLARRAAKARSFTYHHVLAAACLRHHKPHWAELLCLRALAMKPDLVGVKLTLGQALLALGRLDEAEPHLLDFQQKYPQDGDARQALRSLERERARRARLLALPDLGARLRRRWARLRAGLQARRRRAALATPWWLGHLQLAVQREDVEWCYRQLLGRPPESEPALLSHRRCRNFEALARAFVGSSEYQGRVAAHPVATALELRVRAACRVRGLLPLGGAMAEVGATGCFGAAACLQLDAHGRRIGAPSSPVASALELALWLQPLPFDEVAASAALRTLARVLRPQGHALIAIPDDDGSLAGWSRTLAAKGFECLAIEYPRRTPGVALVWARKGAARTASR